MIPPTQSEASIQVTIRGQYPGSNAPFMSQSCSMARSSGLSFWQSHGTGKYFPVSCQGLDPMTNQRPVSRSRDPSRSMIGQGLDPLPDLRCPVLRLPCLGTGRSPSQISMYFETFYQHFLIYVLIYFLFSKVPFKEEVETRRHICSSLLQAL